MKFESSKSETEKRIRSLLSGKTVSKTASIGRHSFKKGEVLEGEVLAQLSLKDMVQIPAKDVNSGEIKEMEENCKDQVSILKSMMKDKAAQLRKGDDLSPGVIKLVKVFLAMKRKLQVGDKMAGRHGNKGVVSTIVPVEDMPYLDDGTSYRAHTQSVRVFHRE